MVADPEPDTAWTPVSSARAGAGAGLGLPRVLPTPGVVDATNAVA